MNNEITTLMNTLVQNNLAGSLEDARKMAESMIGTSTKVNKVFEENTEHFMISGYKKSNNTVMGGVKKEEAHDHPPSFESLSEEADELVHHEDAPQVKNGIQKLTLSNHSTIKTEPKFKESTNGSLSLSNNVMVTQRPKKEEINEELIHQISGATDILKNNQPLDPVTSAPIDPVSIPLENSTTTFAEPVQQEAPQVVQDPVEEINSSAVEQPLMHDVPSFDTLSEEPKLAEPVQQEAPQMTPEEYAAQRMNNEMSLNEMIEKNTSSPVVQEPKPEPVSAPEVSQPTQLSLDNPSTISTPQPVQQSVDSNGNLTLGNSTTISNSAPVQQNNGALSLDNPIMTQSREPEKKEGVLAAGMPDTSSITTMDLDPVTSAPREPQTQKRTVSYSQPSIGGLEESGAYLHMPGKQKASEDAPVQEPSHTQEAQPVASQPVASAPRTVQVPVQQQGQVEAEKTQQIPASSNSNEVNQYGTPKRNPVTLTPEEKKLKEDVDLTKIFRV